MAPGQHELQNMDLGGSTRRLFPGRGCANRVFEQRSVEPPGLEGSLPGSSRAGSSASVAAVGLLPGPVQTGRVVVVCALPGLAPFRLSCQGAFRSRP